MMSTVSPPFSVKILPHRRGRGKGRTRKEVNGMVIKTENRLKVQEEDREMVRLLTTLNQTKRAIVKGFILGLKADTGQDQQESA